MGNISINLTIWMFPLVFLLHDLEEIFTVEKWVSTNKANLQQLFSRYRIPNRILKRVAATDTVRFSIIVASLFVAICTACYLASQGIYTWFVAGLAVLFINVFTHCVQTLIFGGYTPGVITAIVIALPYSLYSFRVLFLARIASWYTMGTYSLLGLIAVVLVFIAGCLIGLAVPKPKHM